MIRARMMRLAAYVARMERKKNACRILVGKADGKRLLERHRRSWEVNIKLYLSEIGWDSMEWIYLAQDRPVESSCEDDNDPTGSI
jgi:hypothetical protein